MNQQSRTGNGPSQQQVHGAQSKEWRRFAVEDDTNEDDDDDDDEDDNDDDDEPRCQSQPKVKARRFRSEDLPGLPETGAPFRDLIIPRWIFYYSSLNSLWKLSNLDNVVHIQSLWDETFPNISCKVALRNDPIFALVCLLFHRTPLLTHIKVRQRTYDWRGDLVACAWKAVEAFFDRYKNFTNAAGRAAYVKWAVPEVKEKIDAHGDRIPVAPKIYPYMWASVVDDPDGPVSHC